MDFCFLAKLVIIFSLLGIIIMNVLFGFSFIFTISNLLFTILFVLLTNWGCNTPGFYWVAVIIAVLHAIVLAASVIILEAYYKKDPEVVKAIQEQKEKEKQKK